MQADPTQPNHVRSDHQDFRRAVAIVLWAIAVGVILLVGAVLVVEGVNGGLEALGVILIAVGGAMLGPVVSVAYSATSDFRRLDDQREPPITRASTPSETAHCLGCTVAADKPFSGNQVSMPALPTGGGGPWPGGLVAEGP